MNTVSDILSNLEKITNLLKKTNFRTKDHYLMSNEKLKNSIDNTLDKNVILGDIPISIEEVLKQIESCHNNNHVNPDLYLLDKYHHYLDLNIHFYVKYNIATLNDILDFSIKNADKVDELKKHLELAEKIYKTEENYKKRAEATIIDELKTMYSEATKQVRNYTLIIIAIIFLMLIFILPPINTSCHWIDTVFNYFNMASLKNNINNTILSENPSGSFNYIIYFLIYFPTISLIWYFISQRSYAVKIATDYKFKLNTLTCFVNSDWINGRILDNNKANEITALLAKDALKVLSENPTRLYSKESEMPIDKIITILKSVGGKG